MSANDYKISKGVVYPPPPTLASDEEFAAGISTTASPSVKQVTNKFATPTDISTATSGLASQEWVEQKILSANPTGTIIVWSTATAPSGYLICDGSAISRTTYSNLFSVIGTTYGDGDGNTTFNLPTQARYLVECQKPTTDDTRWYNLYSDGWLEQGGRFYTDVADTVSLLKPFKDSLYSTVIGSTFTNGTSSYAFDRPIYIGATIPDQSMYTQSSFRSVVGGSAGQRYFYYMSFGYTDTPPRTKNKCIKY